MPIELECNLVAAPIPLSQTWEPTVGSGRALLALCADWREQLRRAHFDLVLSRVRFHGMLDDGMGTLICLNEQPFHSVFNINSIFDCLLSISMQPFVELSFMPATLASGDSMVLRHRGNVTPPRDHRQWGALIDKLVRRWVDRYGVREVSQWYLEVWNEPNLKAFWTGGKKGYYDLYRTTVQAIKNIDPALKVGGPSRVQNAWIPEFLAHCAHCAHCEKHRLPVDFVSTHYYPTDAFSKIGAVTLTLLAHAPRDVMRQRLRGQHRAVSRSVGAGFQRLDLPRQLRPEPVSQRAVLQRLPVGARRPTSALLPRINEDQVHPQRSWQQCDEPDYPSPRQVETLHAASALRPQVHPVRFAEGRIEFEPVMPPQSVAALKIKLARS